MPTYQYSCNDCGHFFEIVQSFSDDSLSVCPECEGRLRKVFNAVGVVFKGSGFYRNDSRPRRPAPRAVRAPSPEAGATGRAAPSGPARAKESGSGKKSADTSSGSSSSSTPAPA